MVSAAAGATVNPTTTAAVAIQDHIFMMFFLFS
jgi:hypothetical protein